MLPDNSQFGNLAAWKSDFHAQDKADQSLVNTKMSQGDFKRKTDENDREVKTREAYREDTPVSELEEAAKRGHPTEISGDAIARLRAGKATKLHKD